MDATIAVTINVTDVNEPPQFADVAESTLDRQPRTLPLASGIGSTYHRLRPGRRRHSDLHSVTAAPMQRTFQVDSYGQLKTKADLDYEADSSYTVIVQATDSKDDNGVADTATDATITVTITVTDVLGRSRGRSRFYGIHPSAGTTLTPSLEQTDGLPMSGD